MQWYDSVPSLFEAEKAAMKEFFPNFELGKFENGHLYWIGELNPGIYETKFGVKKTYTVMVVYNNNYPEQLMGLPVKVYPVFPDVDDIINECGFTPHFLLRDSNSMIYLCNQEAIREPRKYK